MIATADLSQRQAGPDLNHEAIAPREARGTDQIGAEDGRRAPELP